MHPILLDTLIALVPVSAATAIMWRIVWPKRKLVSKMAFHLGIYAVLAMFIGHWSVLFAFLHQVIVVLGSHILFCRKHGFTWYAVEDPERYAQLTKEWEIRAFFHPRASTAV